MKKNETVLLTGASSGIGLELSKLFAGNGYDLVLVARSEDKLKNLADELRSKHGAEVNVIPLDLSDPGSPEVLADRLKRRSINVDILVNNAGFGGSGRFSDTDLKYEMNMMTVNMSVPVKLTKFLLLGMIESRKGKILNVASTAAFVPGPFMSVYYATKAFMLSWSQALSNELKGTGVTVTTLCPGPTRTQFQKQADVDTSRLFSFNVSNAKHVAEKGFSALMKGKVIVIVGVFNRIQIQSSRFATKWFLRAYVRWLNERRKM